MADGKEDIQCAPKTGKFLMHEDSDLTATSATGVMQIRSTDPIFKAYTKQEFEISGFAGISYKMAGGLAMGDKRPVTIKIVKPMETAHAHMTATALLGALGAVAAAMIAITF